MNFDHFRKRTEIFAASVIRLVITLPNSVPNQIMGRQLLRCGTSVGANYRAACRAKSRADFIAKMKIAEEECDESIYWMELMVEVGAIKRQLVTALIKEANELLSMLVASIKTARARN